MTYEDYNVLTCRSLFANNVNVDVACLYSHEKIHIRCEQRDQGGLLATKKLRNSGPPPSAQRYLYFNPFKKSGIH